MERKKQGKARGNRALTVVAGVLVAVCLLAGGTYLDTFHGGGRLQSLLTQSAKPAEKPAQTAQQPEESMAVDVSSKAMMAVFGSEFLLCTKDGVKYYASMGDQKWNDTFNMTSPLLQQEGDYMAVGDMGGKTIRVYNRSGKLYDLQTEGSPVQFALNEQGCLSVITKGTDLYRIRIYNGKGTLLKERVEESRGVYPLCSDISDDGRIFAVSYLDTTDVMPIGRVLFFYINAAESEAHTDSMFAAVEKQGELISVISYRKGGTLAAISDANIYGIGTDGQEKWSYPLQNTIDMLALGAKDMLVFALGDAIADRDGREQGTVCWLNAAGKETASYASGESVSYLSANEKGAVCGNERSYVGLSHNGAESWHYTATTDLSDLLPMEKLSRVMTVGRDTVSILTMSKDTQSARNTARDAQPEEQTPAAPTGEDAGTNAEQNKDQNTERNTEQNTEQSTESQTGTDTPQETPQETEPAA